MEEDGISHRRNFASAVLLPLVVWALCLGQVKTDNGVPAGLPLLFSANYFLGSSHFLSSRWAQEKAVSTAKYSMAADRLLSWNTFHGGADNDWCHGIALDATGNIYITGMSCATWGSPLNPFSGSTNAFVAKLSPSGNLEWNTFIGGGEDSGWGIALAPSGNIYVVGTSFKAWGAPFREFAGDSDAFVVKLNGKGVLQWNTFLGGAAIRSESTVGDEGIAIAVDGGENVFVGGSSISSWGTPIRPLTGPCAFAAKLGRYGDLLWNTFLGDGAYAGEPLGIAVDSEGNLYETYFCYRTWGSPVRAFSGEIDVFAAKLSGSGVLLWNTFLGGQEYSFAGGIALDSDGNSYILGTSGATWGTPARPFTPSWNSKDAFVAKINENGVLQWNTFLGGNGYDYGEGLAVGPGGNIYVIGWSKGGWGSPIRPFYDSCCNSNSFVAKLNGSGALLWHTFLGGIGANNGTGIALDMNGGIFATGDSEISWGAPIHYASGKSDAYIAKLSETNPLINLSQTSLYYGAVEGGISTSTRNVLITNPAVGVLNWTATGNGSWLVVEPASGTGAGILRVRVNSTGLSAGTYSDRVIVSDPNAMNNPQGIQVNLKVYAAGTSAVPFGSFDTPIDGTSGIAGAIPVTGWALDDQEVTKVEIWRDNVTGEAPGQWFIGDGIFVAGARPDVEQACPGYPLNYRAGWGYMLLTNMLPNHGNGTYKLYAFVTDKEGNRVSLGTKTITCSNATAVRPFGTIDSPTQGGDASGSAYACFGWVLTPLPKTVPKDGSTIDVYVDSVKVGNLATLPNVYDQYRVDVATAFPGLNNSGGPVGAFHLDTTKYVNGVHTIYWIATDDAGAADGIGSRYFNIINTGTPAQAGSESINQGKTDLYESVMSLPVSFAPRRVRRGFILKTEPEVLQPDNYGTLHIEIKEVERVEIDLGKAKRIKGYQIVGEELRSLPIGSTLDQTNGTFSWMPGPGFLGKYDLLFLQTDGFGITRRIPVKVMIRPKFEK